MKLLLISDQHGQLFDLPLDGVDLILNAGDICPNFRRDGMLAKDSFAQGLWLDSRYRLWRKRQKAADGSLIPMVGIWGNHDFVGQHPTFLPAAPPFTLLQDELVEVKGLRIWGTPWTRTFYDWAFMEGEEALSRRWAAIPEGLDILLVHGPPEGHCDFYPGPPAEHCGSSALRFHIERVAPKVVVCGHIHEGRGESQLGPSRILNVSSLDGAYRLRQTPYTLLEV